MSSPSADQTLKMAQKHLEKVQEAWPEPTDWSDFAMYGFYCLEAAVVAAATHGGIAAQRTHPSKVAASETLRDKHGLPDISQLLVNLNVARKAAAYGDLDFPKLSRSAGKVSRCSAPGRARENCQLTPPSCLDAERLAGEIERYVDAVAAFLAK